MEQDYFSAFGPMVVMNKKNSRVLILFLVLGVIIGAVTAFAPELSFSVGIIFLGLIAGFICIHVAAPEDINFLLTLFLLGYALRILLAVFFYFLALPFGYCESSLGFEGFFVQDGYGYYHNGLLLNRFWESGFFPDISTFKAAYSLSRTANMYDYFNGVVIWLGGKTPLALFFLNALFDSLSVILIYLIAFRMCAQKKIGRYAAALYCFWPSIILWSTQNLKEPMCGFFIYLALFSLIPLLYKFSPWRILCLISSIYVVSQIRLIFAVILSIVLCVFYLLFIYRSRRKALLIIGSAALGLAAFYLMSKESSVFSRIIRVVLNTEGGGDTNFLLKVLSQYRKFRATGGSSVFPGLEYTSLPKLLCFIPVGIGIVLFMPFPWQMGSVMQLMSAPETIVWYFLFPFTLWGFLFCARTWKPQTILFTAYVILVAIALGIIEGNLGTIFRHRTVIFGVCLIFTSVGLHLRRPHD